jgi:hypothetical protein
MDDRHERRQLDELLDEESIAVLAILLAVSLEFSFGFAKTVDWWAGLLAGPVALVLLIAVLKVPPTRRAIVRLARWIVRPSG